MHVYYRNTSKRGPVTRALGVCLLMLLMAFGQRATAASGVTVKASLDSATLLMGRTTRLHLQVEKPNDRTGHFPILTNADSRPYATLLGDTIELSKSFTTDTVKLPGDVSRINYHIPVQVFDSGYYRIPGFQYVSGADTLYSNPLDLKVVPVNAKATDKISGLTDVAEPAPGSWLDKVPDWVIEYWWAMAAGIILLVVLALLVRKWLRARKSKPKAKVVVPPYQEALDALNLLRGKELWQRGQNELYFVELTDILRRYLSRRFGVAAPEMTTSQFLEEASHNPKISDHGEELRRLLQLADFIKFAKGDSLPAENEEAFSIVRKFVEDTRPTPEEEAAERLKAKADGIELKSAPRKKSGRGGRKDSGKGKSGKEVRR